MQVGPHRVDRDSQDLGDLGVLEAAVIPQRHHDPPLRPQFFDAPRQRRTRLAGLEEKLGGRFHGGKSLDGLSGVGEVEGAPFSPFVMRRVQGDPRQPRKEGPVWNTTLPVLPCPQPRLLDEGLRLTAVGSKPTHEAYDQRNDRM